MALVPLAAFTAVDHSPDPAFAPEIDFERIDAAALAAITRLYREILPAGGAILDVMSGWVPHLPPEAPFRRVVGIGLDKRALSENPFLDEWRVQDLKPTPALPLGAGGFDGATVCGLIQDFWGPRGVNPGNCPVFR